MTTETMVLWILTQTSVAVLFGNEPEYSINVPSTEFLPHPAGGEATSQVGPKIVLDHVRVYIYIYIYIYINYVCALWISSPLVVYDAIDNASSSRAHED